MSRTIEAIMRHMTPPSNRVTNQPNGTEKLEREFTVREAALCLVGSEIRPRHDAVSLQRARRLRRQGSGRQERPGPNDTRAAGRIDSAGHC